MKGLLFSILVMGLMLAGCEAGERVRTLKLAHGHDQLHPVHLSMVYMTEVLDSLSGNRLRIKIYPNAQLGKERELIELLQIGMVDICKVSAAIMENFEPEFQLFSYPYLFSGKEHFFRVLEGETGRRLLKKTENYLLTGLTWYDAGSRCLYTVDQEVQTPSDLTGLKIRVMQNNTSLKMARAMGASPTPIAQAELYTALQQGVVDGAENNVPTFLSNKHFEVCKYYMLSDHNFIPDILLAGTKTMDRLNSEERELLFQAAVMSAEYHKRAWRVAEERSMEEIKKAGVEVVEIDKQAFLEKVKGFYDDLDNSHLRAVVEEIRRQQ